MEKKKGSYIIMQYKKYEGKENNLTAKIQGAIDLAKKDGCVYSIFWENNNEIYSTDRGTTVEEIEKNSRISEYKKAELRTKHRFISVKSAINDLKRLDADSAKINIYERVLENIGKLYGLRFNEEKIKTYLEEISRLTGITKEFNYDDIDIETNMGKAENIIRNLFDNFGFVQCNFSERIYGDTVQRDLASNIDEIILNEGDFAKELTLQEKKQIAEEQYKAQEIQITELEAKLTKLKADKEKTGNEIAGFEEKE